MPERCCPRCGSPKKRDRYITTMDPRDMPTHPDFTDPYVTCSDRWHR